MLASHGALSLRGWPRLAERFPPPDAKSRRPWAFDAPSSGRPVIIDLGRAAPSDAPPHTLGVVKRHHESFSILLAYGSPLKAVALKVVIECACGRQSVSSGSGE